MTERSEQETPNARHYSCVKKLGEANREPEDRQIFLDELARQHSAVSRS